MSGNNRFHNKFHRADHHSQATPGIPGSGTDPIASSQYPFIGDFNLTGTLSSQSNMYFNNAFGNITYALSGSNVLTTYDRNIVLGDVITNTIYTGVDHSAIIGSESCNIFDGAYSLILGSFQCNSYGAQNIILNGINCTAAGSHLCLLNTTGISAYGFDTTFAEHISAVSIHSWGTPITIAVKSGAGSGATATVRGNNISGLITINTGTNTVSNSQLVSATFSTWFALQPIVVISPANVAAASTFTPFASANIKAFTLNSGISALSATAVYQYNYHVIG